MFAPRILSNMGSAAKAPESRAALSETTTKGRPMSVDQKTVRHIARLARIAVRDDELPALAGELNSILDWVEQLREVDTNGVEPMTSAVAMSMKMREDVVTAPNLQKEVTMNAPGAEDGFYVVPKVVE
jgi:aspartyl-tRNA(Asn)/glutamyl-tRNA(Gln) amidotransferase subunit C